MQRGAMKARKEDTESLLAVVLDWIILPGTSNIPPLQPSERAARGFHHTITGALLCPVTYDWSDPFVRSWLRRPKHRAGLGEGDWPCFIFDRYNPDRPFEGFLRGPLLVKAFTHLATSSSHEQDTRLPLTISTIIYTTIQVHYVLSSEKRFGSGHETVGEFTETQELYFSLEAWRNDPDNAQDVTALMEFWTSTITSESLAAL